MAAAQRGGGIDGRAGRVALRDGGRPGERRRWELRGSAPRVSRQGSRSTPRTKHHARPLRNPPRAASPVHAQSLSPRADDLSTTAANTSPLRAHAMAAAMPIPVPPRTPTPPPEDPPAPVGLGLPDQELGRDALSPMSATFPSQSLGSLSPSSANLTPRTPNSAYYTPQMSATSEEFASKTATPETPANPFNFQPQQYVVGKPPAKSSVRWNKAASLHALGPG